MNRRQLEAPPAGRGAYRCARCNSSKLKKLSLLYLQGTATRNSFILGFYRDLKGNFFGNVFGVRQSLLAKRAAPPRKKSLLVFGLLWLVVCVVVALIGVMALPVSEEPVLAPAGALLCLVLFVGGIILQSRHIQEYNEKVWARTYSQWERSYLCMQCGRVNVIQ